MSKRNTAKTGTKPKEAPRKTLAKMISITDLARRAGVAASALRFYEAEGLLVAERASSGRRFFRKTDLRRVAFIKAAQAVGLSITDIKQVLDQLPENRTPTKKDWSKLSASWVPLIEEKIDELTALKSALTGCIGCGCLSLKVCALYNPQDRASCLGQGARYLLGNSAADLPETDEER